MDWENEDWVKLYTRDTADLLAIGPEGRLVWYEMLRKVDRAGVIDTAGDLEILPELLRVPIPMFEVGWARIVARNMVEIRPTAILIPNFDDAQRSRQSDAQRQKASRERRRARVRAQELQAGTPSVTNCDESESQNVTGASQSVTSRVERVERLDVSREDPHPRHPGEQVKGDDPNADEDTPPTPSEHLNGYDLEAVYALYPRKAGKAKGLQKLEERSHQKGFDYDRILAAVRSMAETWKGKSTTFCPHFSTFVNGQRWLDDELPQPDQDNRRGYADPSTDEELEASQEIAF